MTVQTSMEERNPPGQQSPGFFWPFSRSSGNLAALLNPSQGSSLENVVTNAAAAAAAAAANAAVAAVFSAAGMPNPNAQGSVIRPEPTLGGVKNPPDVEPMRQSTTQSLLDTLQAALVSQKEEGTSLEGKEGQLEGQPNLGLSLDCARSQSSQSPLLAAAFRAANNGDEKRGEEAGNPPEGGESLLTRLQLALSAASRRDEREGVGHSGGGVHRERDLVSAMEASPRQEKETPVVRNDAGHQKRRAALWEEACEEEERGVGVAAVDATGQGFSKSGSGYSSGKGGGSGVIWPDENGKVADPLELSKRSASIAWPEDSAQKKDPEPWVVRREGSGKLGAGGNVAAMRGPAPERGGNFLQGVGEQQQAEALLRQLAQMAGAAVGTEGGLQPASFSLSLGDIQQLSSSSPAGKSGAPLTLATASLRRLLGLVPLPSPDQRDPTHHEQNGFENRGAREDVDAQAPFDLNPLPRSGSGVTPGPAIAGFKRERLESIERYKEKRRRRQLNVLEPKQSEQSDDDDDPGGGEAAGGIKRVPTPPRMRGPMPSPSPKQERSGTPPPSREGSPGVTVAQPAGGRRRRLAQLPADEAKAKNVMAHRASAARSNAKKKAALERVQRMEAMLEPVRSALVAACDGDEGLKTRLLQLAGSNSDALSKFLDRELSLDDLLQAVPMNGKK